MRKPVFTGSAVAIITPFRDDFVDFVKLGELIDMQIENGSDAIVICGTTGEASAMSTPEHLAAVEYCVKKVAGRVPVIAGTGSNDTAHAVVMSKHAQTAGVDALLVVTPYYNKTTQHGLVKHFNYIADRVDIPIILYNVPSRTNLSFTAETYAELAKHPNICGVKEASGNFTLCLDIRYHCPDDFYIWSGNDEIVVPLMSIGAKGVISAVANVIPRAMSDMVKLCVEGTYSEASELQIKYSDLIKNLFIEVNPVPVKTAMNMMGLDVGPLRMPLTDMTGSHLDLLRKSLINAGIKIS